MIRLAMAGSGYVGYDLVCVDRNADMMQVITAWNMFRGPGLRRLRAGMAGDVSIDMRNVNDQTSAVLVDMRHVSVGREAPD